MGVFRQMKRKAAREWSYDYYARQKEKAAYQRRYNVAMVKIGEKWKRTVRGTVPEWLQYAAEKYVSPPWFDHLLLRILKSLPSNSFVEGVIKSKLPRWVKWSLLVPQTWLRTIINLFIVGPVVWLKQKIRSFGIRTSIRKKDKDTLHLRIWYWFELIEESTWPL